MKIEQVDGNHDQTLIYQSQHVSTAPTSSEFESMLLETVLACACLDEHFSGIGLPPQLNDFGWQEQIQNGQMTEVTSPDLIAASYTQSPTSSNIQPSDNISSTDAFVQRLWPHLKDASMRCGLNPKILLAQAALETGWGKHIIKTSQGVSSHNLFNIKAIKGYQGDSVEVDTIEYDNHQPVSQKAAFKFYSSIAESVHDYVDLIQYSSRYQPALAHRDSPEHYLNALQSAGYATDPDYANKIMTIYHGRELEDALVRLEGR